MRRRISLCARTSSRAGDANALQLLADFFRELRSLRNAAARLRDISGAVALLQHAIDWRFRSIAIRSPDRTIRATSELPTKLRPEGKPHPCPQAWEPSRESVRRARADQDVPCSSMESIRSIPRAPPLRRSGCRQNVARKDHVKLRWAKHDLHRGVVHVEMIERHARVLAR